MDYRRYSDKFVVRIDRGEEVISSLLALQEKEDIRTAIVEGIGAASYVQFGLYDVQAQHYNTNEKEEPLEITSLEGNMTQMDGKPYLHVHITVADKEGNVYGGHLNKAIIGGTCELFITDISEIVERKKDDFSGTGLNLFDF